jgi:NhaA family Na+:H+ antiporter
VPGPVQEAPEPTPIGRLTSPFQAFAEKEAAGGILLLVCTALALAMANSPWANDWARFWHIGISVRIGSHAFSHNLLFLVNDLLMSVFFFVVGLEIKREILAGELASPRRAALPILAALGGVVFPAAIFAAFNHGGPGARGWAVPMATDIAFAIGAMALLGDRVPTGLRVFLTALAIVDDLAAVVVIAIFYTSDIDWSALTGAALCLALLFLLGRLGTRRPLTWAIGGAVLWGLMLASGVHVTIAGVALALVVPAQTTFNPGQFVLKAKRLLRHFETAAETKGEFLSSDEQQTALHALEAACEYVQPPLHRMEHALHPWVTFVIMPLFALANAGVRLGGAFDISPESPATPWVMAGVATGLLLGKPLGITLASWLAVRSGLAALPDGVTWGHIHGAAWLGGIGFTMSLFIASLAFADERLLTAAKLGILLASALAGLIGSLFLRRCASAVAKP